MFLLASLVVADDASVDGMRYWPQWRGPLANGVAPKANPPIEWGEKKNIRWKIELPGKGHSSPIVFADRVFLLAAAPIGEAQTPVLDSAPGVHDSVPVTHRHQYMVIAVARNDGHVLWKKVVREVLTSSPPLVWVLIQRRPESARVGSPGGFWLC